MSLSRESIARAGLAILDRDGPDRLTMRRLATALGVQAPALYWHVKNRRDLIDAMAEEMFRDIVESFDSFDASIASWDELLVAGAHALRRAMLRYHHGGRILAGTFVPNGPQVVEPVLRAMTAAGFTAGEAARHMAVAFHYTIGFTIEQQAQDGSEYPGTNPYEDEAALASLELERYPVAAEAFATLYRTDFDADFAGGLAVIVDGLRARLDA